MAKRLVKIAKELNVGTSTIVDFLSRNGFDIDNKPTAKITEEMYTELLKEFERSIDIKERANKINIGVRPKKETPNPGVDVAPPPPANEPPETTADTPAPEPEPEKKEEVVERVKVPQPQLKVLGKIDLNKSLKKRVKQKEAAKREEKKEEPKPVEQKVEPKKTTTSPEPEQPVIEAKEQQPEDKSINQAENQTKQEVTSPPPAESKIETTTQKVVNEPPVDQTTTQEGDGSGTDQPKKTVIRAEAPELRGLKILGKIDTNKFQRPKKKKKKDNKEKEREKPTPSNTTVRPKPNREGPPKERERRARTRDERSRVRPGSNTGGGNNRRPGTTGPNKPGSGSGATGGNDDKKNKQTPSNNKPGQQGQGPQRKKRKRKKVAIESKNDQRSPDQGRNRQPRSRKPIQKDEVKEVSQKEIEEKIKATMARLQGGGKKRRQKLQRDKRDRLREKQERQAEEQVSGKLEVTEFISVSELASLMDVAVTDVITTCMNLGIIVSINQRLDAEIIELVAEEFGHEVDFIKAEEQGIEEEEEEQDDPADLEPRNPIVTVMGHVDHGKTSLLDYIREANVASGEAGGITQHIGAYEVKTESGQGVTFLDTPGHEAFTAMRARGAKVTDISIIIIAADDSIMPQTREAISHSQAAGVPMVFAINKVDKNNAQPERIKQELASMNLLVEEWGGTYQSQDISAKTGQGIPELIEKVLLEAEILELKANPARGANGTVIEASLDKGRGYVTKVLIQNGTLHVGDPIVAGEYSGKVRAMLNERGKRLKEAGPSKPVLILGLDGAPQAGERVREVDTEQEARAIASKRAQISREQANRATKRISLDEIGRRLALGTFKELNLIVKGDVDGSIEALSDSLIKLSVETVQVNVIHKAVGQIIESDVLLASASDAIIIGFQVRPSLGARKLAEKEGVQIKMYSVIYDAIEEIKMAIEGMLEPTKEEKIVAEVEVRNIFKISKVGTVAGCIVKDGKIARDSHIRLIRDGIVVYPTKEGVHGRLASLKRFKDDVREVKNGLECGLAIENFNDIKVGDVVEGYEIIEIKQRLS